MKEYVCIELWKLIVLAVVFIMSSCGFFVSTCNYMEERAKNERIKRKQKHVDDELIEIKKESNRINFKAQKGWEDDV